MALFDLGNGGGSKLPYKVFHADHGVSERHIRELALMAVPRSGFFLRTIRLPVGFDDLMTGLYGPIMGDAPVRDSEVTLKVRNNRPGPSRMIARPHRRTRLMTMIGARDESGVTFYTIYGGPSAPREPWDTSMSPAERAEAAEFWSQHALALTGGMAGLGSLKRGRGLGGEDDLPHNVKRRANLAEARAQVVGAEKELKWAQSVAKEAAERVADRTVEPSFWSRGSRLEASQAQFMLRIAELRYAVAVDNETHVYVSGLPFMMQGNYPPEFSYEKWQKNKKELAELEAKLPKYVAKMNGLKGLGNYERAPGEPDWVQHDKARGEFIARKEQLLRELAEINAGLRFGSFGMTHQYRRIAQIHKELDELNGRSSGLKGLKRRRARR